MCGYQNRDLNEGCSFYVPCRIKGSEQTRRGRDQICDKSDALVNGNKKLKPAQNRQVIPYRDANKKTSIEGDQNMKKEPHALHGGR